MNRRECLKMLATLGASFALPAWAIESASEKDIDADWLELQSPKITRIRVGHLPRYGVEPPPEDGYWAEAIEDGDKLYYRVSGTTVEITEYEFRLVIRNPYLYYFSTALYLHFRIERAKAKEEAYHA